MNITFIGAAGEVTGSCYLVEAAGKKFLVDCGMFQGGAFNEQKNSAPFPFDPAEIGAVILTHAHLDHCGRLPLLVKQGFTGKIYATAPTAELAELIWEDAYGVMDENNRRYGESVLYDISDVSEAKQFLQAVDYGEIKVLDEAGKINFVFRDAGHIFGSAFVEIHAENKIVVFSGDIGNVNAPIIRETDALPVASDLVVCESTYGDRIHETVSNRYELIATAVVKALGRGGILMIPSFALERTQELLYVLNHLIDFDRRLPRVPIFLDSPLAIKATKVFQKYPQYYDHDAKELFSAGDDLFDFSGLTVCATTEDSKKINATPGAKIIIAGAGMMNGGRILHHALRYLSDEKNTLLFIGYQAEGTLGRQIFDGAAHVKIMNERVAVRCQVEAIGALSAHGDQNKLVSWLGGDKNALPKKIILSHGEPPASAALAARLKSDLNVNVLVALAGESEIL